MVHFLHQGGYFFCDEVLLMLMGWSFTYVLCSTLYIYPVIWHFLLSEHAGFCCFMTCTMCVSLMRNFISSNHLNDKNKALVVAKPF